MEYIDWCNLDHKHINDSLRSFVLRNGTFFSDTFIMIIDNIIDNVLPVMSELKCRMFKYKEHYYIAYDL